MHTMWDPLSFGDQVALIAAVLTGIAVVLTGIAVVIAVRQLRDSHKTAFTQMNQSNQYARGQNWLALRNILTNYDDIHAKFRPGGDWYRSRVKPDTVDDWARTELYMGIFEFLKELLDQGMLDPTTIKDWYSYRINNLLENPRVVKYKLVDNADGWPRFLALYKSLGIKKPPLVEVGPFLGSSEGPL